MKRIGIVGCGAIGRGIAEFIQTNLKHKARIVALCDIDSEKANTLSKKITPPPVITTIDNLIKKSDLIIEAASVSISGSVAEKAVGAKKDVLIMSTGGLLKKLSLFEKARLKGCNIYIPSGAICGLDGVRSASIGNIKKVTLTTRKPPEGLRGAPYLEKKKIDIDKIKEETLIYSGTAENAIRYFPQNINVASTLSLLGIGPTRTKVRIITSPKYTKNIHEIEVEGEFGSLFTKTENVPSKINPKTSQLAIFSAIAKLEEVV
jgi:aspartate dehydrogenase